MSTDRTVAAEYLIAVKLMSGRQYKSDLSDIAGILLEHQQAGSPISREDIDKAITTLYGEDTALPAISIKTVDAAFSHGDYEGVYNTILENEKQAKEILLDFDKTNPGKLRGESIDVILEHARQKRDLA